MSTHEGAATDETALVIPKAAGVAALADLDKVPWDTLAHAFGKGTIRREGRNPFTKAVRVSVQPGVNVHLRDLVSTDGEDRERAVNDGLFATMWHQGTIFEATAYAVPFLAAMIADPDVPTRQSVLRALQLILAAALRAPTDRDHQRVLRSFEASRDWLERAAQAGPPPATRLLERLSGLAREPLITEEISEELDQLAAELEAG
jgi:hypothetical protein